MPRRRAGAAGALARVRAEQEMFDALASRFAVSTYVDTSGQDRG